MVKKAKVLLVMSGLFTFAMGLSNVFVNIFLWKKSNDFIVIAQYNLMHYLFVPVTFILAGWIAKKKNGVWPLRIGIVLFAIFYICILILKAKVVKYVILIGILYGIAGGFYWLAFQVLTFDLTSPENRDTFNGLNGTIASSCHSVAPFIAAFIIHKSEGITGYSIVFGTSVTIFTVLVLISILLGSERYEKELVFRKLLSNNSLSWAIIRKSTAVWGMRDTVMMFLITVLIFKTTGSELALGKLAFFSHLILAATFAVEQKIIKPERRVISIHVGAIFMFIAVIGLGINISYLTVLIYIIVNAIFMPFFIVPMMSAGFNVINKYHEEKMRIEYVINKEIALNLGRAVSASVLILLLMFLDKPGSLNYFLVFIGGMQLISVYYLKKLDIWEG